MFPRESRQDYLNLSDKHYSYRVRDRLGREVLVPLRKALELQEVYMCACKFEALPYARVASLAMNKYNVFQKHDKHRVVGFFNEGCTGCVKMLADVVLPHDEAAVLQWRRMHGCLSSG